MDRIELRPPPVLAHAEAGGALMGALPVLGSLGSIGLVATMADGRRQYVGIGLFIAAAVLVAVAQLERQRRQRVRAVDAARRDYLAHLWDVRAQIRAAAESRRAAALARHPPPRALAALAECGAWRPGGGLTLRYGTADLPSDAAPAMPPIAAGADVFCSAAVRRLVTAHASQPGLPATIDMAGTRDLSAPPATARALVCSAAGCPDVTVAVLASPEVQGRWDWVKWLSQTSGRVADGVGPRRLVADSMDELAPLLHPHRPLLLVVDGVSPPSLEVPATLLHVADRLTADGRPLLGTPDACTVEVAEAFARRSGRAKATTFPTGPEWSPRADVDHLRVSLGASDTGEEVLLDLKESALGGSGPHGMVVGATGSGKSELLRALVLRLALAHPPADLNLVLIDFKGGAAFDGLARLPHVSALITNLADEVGVLDRMGDALTSELIRRQEVTRAANGDRSSLPTLLVVVDEFAELLAARPELDELFATLGRVGRGLGIHLLLASQRLDDGRWRGLESHLSYRIGLRTFTAEESRAVLGVTDAYELPPVPGLGYLRTDPRTLVRFRAPYVGAAVHSPSDPQRVLPFTTAPVDGPVPEPVTVVDAAVAAVAAMRDRGSAHRIWLPPLERPATLGELLPHLAADPARGFGQRSSTVPLGEIDRPRLQRRDPLEVDLTAGHTAVVGVAGSGRSALLRTAVSGLALTRTPDEVAVYLLDLGGALSPLAGLPHVAAIAGREEPDLADRLVRDLSRGTDRPAVLVVDGWGELRQDLPDLEEEVTRLALRARSSGVHLLVSTTRWAELRASVRDALGTRIELRLGDPLDSEVDRRLAAAVPRGRPGRGIADGAHFLAALASLDRAREADPALAALVDTVDRHWHGRRPHRLRALPGHVRLVDLPASEQMRLGIREGDHSVRTMPSSGHLVVLGDGGSGRTGLLRTLVREIARTRPCDQVVVVDPRATLAGDGGAGHLHVTGDPAGTVDELARSLTGRLGGRVGGGPDVWVVVDDLDLIPSTSWQPLLPLLARSTDVGLHAVVARRTGGAARAFYEPLLGALRDLRSPGVLLAGSPEEGPLLAGVRPLPAVPGRARWVGKDGVEGLFQVAWTEP